MKKIISYVIICLAASCSINAQEPSVPATYSGQKSTALVPFAKENSSTALTKVGAGKPVSAMFLTMDLSEVYSKYTKAIQAQESFDQAEEAARKEMNDMIQAGIKLGEEYKELFTKANNPALTEDAKRKFMLEAEGKAKAIEEKQIQISQYQQQANQTLAQRKQSVMNLHLSDMKEVCAKIAKERGANIVLNTTGIAVMYHDGSADITGEVIEMLNVTKK